MKNRVILSTTYNKTYTDCANLVTHAWEKHGFIPTLFVVGEKKYDFAVSPKTEIVEIGSIEGISDAFVAQNIRTVAPVSFLEDICITGDIDMVPMNQTYFTTLAMTVKHENFVVASSDAYLSENRFPICYFLGFGKTFLKILGLEKELETNEFWFEDYMKQQHAYGLGWDTDEIIFTKKLLERTEIDLVKLSRGWETNRFGRIARFRLDRVCWKETFYAWKETGECIDAHLPRPYTNNDYVIQILEDMYV